MRMPFIPSCFTVTLMLLLGGFLWSCNAPKEEARAPVVSKRIAAQEQLQPAASGDETVAETTPTAEPIEAAAEEPAAIVASRIYDPEQRLNPFAPLFRAEKETVPDAQPQTGQKKKRAPLTPLERISLNQLKLVAVIRAPSGDRALVEDNSGKGYIIQKGTYIGLNSGTVTQINPNGAVVEEEVENLLGELVLQNTEMKIQKPAGE